MAEIKPVKRYAYPRYPTREQAALDPVLLEKLPRRFAAKPAVCAALAAVLSLGLAGCTASPDTDGEPTLGNIPIFSHGEGMGSYGCVSVAPPVFLSEEEAISIIREEAAVYGLEFTGEKTLEKAQLPCHNTAPSEKNYSQPLKTQKGALTLDGYSEQLGIGFEFVSVEDLQNWPDPKQEMYSSVESYFFKDAADALANNNGNIAVFYDPACADFSEFNYEWPEEDDGGAGYTAYAEEYAAKQKAKSEEALRAQVKDFLEWLQGQGVI